ncbi:MAG TPA: hypothetical protein VFG14_02840 [Chthoniobacteraceae bacterium]|nr:hypothetical protein [Chthoniobacteraceae bacterium]
MTEAEVKRIVAETVEQTLLTLGVDTEDPIELQKDLAHLRAWRESMETVRKQSLITAVGIIVAGVIGLIWLAMKGQGHG